MQRHFIYVKKNWCVGGTTFFQLLYKPRIRLDRMTLKLWSSKTNIFVIIFQKKMLDHSLKCKYTLVSNLADWILICCTAMSAMIFFICLIIGKLLSNLPMFLSSLQTTILFNNQLFKCTVLFQRWDNNAFVGVKYFPEKWASLLVADAVSSMK